MTIYGGFSIPTYGMQSQAYALDVIGNNVANVNTGGYKRTDVRFETVLSDSYRSTGYSEERKSGNVQSDINGTRPKDYMRISTQGLITATDNNLDLAINGDGFFILNTDVDGSGTTYYSRDGAFETKINGTSSATADDGSTINVSTGYLVDKNGYYVMGWEPDADGTFSDTGSLTALRVDQFAFTDTGMASTEARLNINLDAADDTGGTFTYNVDIFDSEGDKRSVAMTFTKDATVNQWTASASTGNALDTVNSVATTMTFDSFGQLTAGSPFSIDIAWSDGATSLVSLDLSECTQYAGAYNPVSYWKDGYVAADMTGINFDTEGHVVGTFEDDSHRRVYKVALASFVNPDQLQAMPGMTFKVTEDSGDATVFAASSDGRASFTPNAHELSNVDLADQFTKLMLTQTAYNSSATAFKTMDEMMQDAKALK
ncbi:MAG: flagellar hook-basal body complex protein [Magnetospirillum sp. WYHS-4]